MISSVGWAFQWVDGVFLYHHPCFALCVWGGCMGWFEGTSPLCDRPSRESDKKQALDTESRGFSHPLIFPKKANVVVAFDLRGSFGVHKEGSTTIPTQSMIPKESAFVHKMQVFRASRNVFRRRVRWGF
jgi:hypothetical protein